jgi:hypothetical protein
VNAILLIGETARCTVAAFTVPNATLVSLWAGVGDTFILSDMVAALWLRTVTLLGRGPYASVIGEGTNVVLTFFWVCVVITAHRRTYTFLIRSPTTSIVREGAMRNYAISLVFDVIARQRSAVAFLVLPDTSLIGAWTDVVLAIRLSSVIAALGRRTLTLSIGGPNASFIILTASMLNAFFSNTEGIAVWTTAIATLTGPNTRLTCFFAVVCNTVLH